MEGKDIHTLSTEFQAAHPEILVDKKEKFTFDDEKKLVKPHLQDKSSSVVVCNLQSISSNIEDLVEGYGSQLKYYYTVEEFAEPTLLELLNKLGFYFNCWTLGQINACKKAGVPVEKILYLHYSTEETVLRNMKAAGITRSFVDDVNDVQKFKDFWPEAKLNIQMNIEKETSYGMKCTSFEYAKDICNKAKELGVTVEGLMVPAILYNKNAKFVQDYYKSCADFISWSSDNGHKITEIVIGSDMEMDDPKEGEEEFCFVEKAKTVSENLKNSFGSLPGLNLYLDVSSTVTEDAFNLYVQVIGVKQLRDPAEVDPKKVPTVAYYLTEGIYGCLTYFFDTENPEIDYECFNEEIDKEEDHIKTVLWGPTCDSLDVCKTPADLPKLNVGDWIIFPAIGGQSISLRSDFNWVEKYTLVYYFADLDVDDEEEVKK